MEVVAEERRFDGLTKFARSLVTAEIDLPDAVPFRCMPLPVKPRTGDHEVHVFGVVLVGVAKDLPRPPWIFLIPEACDIQKGNGRGVQLPDPSFFLPELVIVRVG